MDLREYFFGLLSDEEYLDTGLFDRASIRNFVGYLRLPRPISYREVVRLFLRIYPDGLGPILAGWVVALEGLSLSLLIYS